MRHYILNNLIKERGLNVWSKIKKNNGCVNWWLFKDEGTVAKQRTVKEIWNDPAVKKEITAVRNTFNKKPKQDNN